MPRTKKTADVKATETKTPEVKEVVKAAPVETVKEPVKAEPKKAGRKPAAKKSASSVKEEKHDIVRLPDAITEGTKLVFDENGKTKIVNVSEKDTDKKTVKKAGRKPAAKKTSPAKKEDVKTVAAPAPVEEVKAPEKAETKAEPKKLGRKPAAKKAATPTKTEKKAAKPVTTSVLQVAGSEFDFDKVVKAVEGLKKKNAGKSLEIYIKPEDHAVYYVVNGKGGKKIDI